MATTYEVHPAIGVARLGASDDFFLAPEPDVAAPAVFRDGAGALLRQAARFRVFRCERDARGVLQDFEEITRATARIAWTVAVANRKAVAPRILGNGRRNGATGDDAQDAPMIIRPVARTLTDAEPAAVFDDGRFLGAPVTLGEARIDADGRLLFLGGRGESASPTGAPLKLWAESDGWFDDIADGPVRARLTLADTGEVVDALAAWVVVGPPDFAPGIANLVTLYDTLYDVAEDRGFVAGGRLPALPPLPAWDRDVKPILDRALGYQWVNGAAQANHGPGGLADFNAPQWAGIDDPARPNTNRQRIFTLLRRPGAAPHRADGRAMPRLYADEYLSQGQNQDRLPLSRRQYAILEAWASGRFVRSAPPTPEPLPEALTRTALEACVGGAFVPGIEVTRTVRDHRLYLPDEPFRLSPDVAPGTLTASMALPWQTDFTDCAWDDGPQMGWWPAQRPNEVFDGPAGAAMVDWLRGFPTDSSRALWEAMIAHWSELGVVRAVTVAGETRFVEGERRFVEGERRFAAAPVPAGGAVKDAALSLAATAELPASDDGVIRKVEERRRVRDVAVIGGGTAGAAVAAALARAGLDAVVFDRREPRAADGAQYRVGECLPPAARPLLERLGVWQRFLSDPAHVSSPGVRSAWGAGAVRVRDHLFAPGGRGWLLNRAAFDDLLSDAAATAGADVLVGCRVRHWDGGTRDRPWRVTFDTGGGRTRECRAHFLIDATGRAASVARANGATVRRPDRLVGRYAFFAPSAGAEDNRPLVESTPHGWWYSAGLPGGHLVACFFTERGSPADGRHGGRGEPSGWPGAALLADAPHTALRLDGARRPLSPERRVAANSAFTDPPAGTGWMAVGDAALAFDPLASAGLLWALRSALEAAVALRNGWPAPQDVDALTSRWAAGFRSYLRQRAFFYAIEGRWPGSPFWEHTATPGRATGAGRAGVSSEPMEAYHFLQETDHDPNPTGRRLRPGAALA